MTKEKIYPKRPETWPRKEHISSPVEENIDDEIYIEIDLEDTGIEDISNLFPPIVYIGRLPTIGYNGRPVRIMPGDITRAKEENNQTNIAINRIELICNRLYKEKGRKYVRHIQYEEECTELLAEPYPKFLMMVLENLGISNDTISMLAHYTLQKDLPFMLYTKDRAAIKEWRDAGYDAYLKPKHYSMMADDIKQHLEHHVFKI